MSFVLWHAEDTDAYDRCSLLPIVGGHRMTGTAVVTGFGPNATARYIVDVDGDWCVRSVDVRFSATATDHRVVLRTTAPGEWTRDGVPVPHLDGVLDVGLGFTPVGLTPLVHRVGTVERLQAGDRVDVDVVHLDLPDLEPARTTVGVSRDGDQWFHHEHGTTQRLGLGPGGLVSHYGATWRAAAAG